MSSVSNTSEIPTLPFQPKSSCFWRIFPATRFHLIFSRCLKLCLTSLLAWFFAVFLWFPGHFYSFGILACGNFERSNALDCLAFVQVLQHTSFSFFPQGGARGCGNLPIFYFTGLESLIHWCKSLIARVYIKLVYSLLYDWESYQIMPTHSFAWQCKLTKKMKLLSQPYDKNLKTSVFRSS